MTVNDIVTSNTRTQKATKMTMELTTIRGVIQNVYTHRGHNDTAPRGWGAQCRNLRCIIGIFSIIYNVVVSSCISHTIVFIVGNSSPTAIPRRILDFCPIHSLLHVHLYCVVLCDFALPVGTCKHNPRISPGIWRCIHFGLH